MDFFQKYLETIFVYHIYMEKIVKNSLSKYHCKLCDYKCSKKSHWIQHISTRKHKMVYNGTSNDTKNSPTGQFVCECGRHYKFRSGLYRHKKKCTSVMEPLKNVKNPKDIVTHVDDLGKKQVTMSLEQYETLVGGIKKLIPLVEKGLENDVSKITNINNINNKLSINVFLNEHCKDAMNLTDFVENLKVNIEDLMYTKENGYAKGISNIFVKQLQDMEPTQRPIHCSDNKRMKFYVKDDDKWNKDAANTKIDEAVLDVDRKQWRAIKEWERENPDYEKSDKLYKEYMELVRATMGGGNKKTIAINSKQIKKELGCTVKISSDLLNSTK